MINNTQPELDQIEVKGVTRQAFLLRGALGVGAVYGAGMVAPFVTSAFASTDATDVDILNFALTLEYLESDFYKTGLHYLSGAALKEAKLFGKEEAAHVAALTSVIKKLGGKPVVSPKFKFPVTNQKSFLKLAVTLEDTGVSAYNGAAPAIVSKEILAAAGSIVQIEARHAAVVRILVDETPAPHQFDPTLTKAQVLAAVGPLVKA
jgi:rubrerythrin